MILRVCDFISSYIRRTCFLGGGHKCKRPQDKKSWLAEIVGQVSFTVSTSHVNNMVFTTTVLQGFCTLQSREEIHPLI